MAWKSLDANSPNCVSTTAHPRLTNWQSYGLPQSIPAIWAFVGIDPDRRPASLDSGAALAASVKEKCGVRGRELIHPRARVSPSPSCTAFSRSLAFDATSPAPHL